jgi:hypothetical protein
MAGERAKGGKKNRKFGRNSKKCQRYFLENRREKNKKRKKNKLEKHLLKAKLRRQKKMEKATNI